MEYDMLEHHGILGMHWGIRRYQNEDGTLTEAGKKRYRTNEDVSSSGETRRQVIDRLNRSASRNERLSESYYDKSDRKKMEDDFRDDTSFGGTIRRAAYSVKAEKDSEGKTKRYKYDVDEGFDDYLNDQKKWGIYNEKNDKNLQKSEKYSDRARSESHDARALGVDYVRDKRNTMAILSGIAGAGLAGLHAYGKGSSGKKAALEILAGGLGGASIGAITGNAYGKNSQRKAENKYGFR